MGLAIAIVFQVSPTWDVNVPGIWSNSLVNSRINTICIFIRLVRMAAFLSSYGASSCLMPPAFIAIVAWVTVAIIYQVSPTGGVNVASGINTTCIGLVRMTAFLSSYNASSCLMSSAIVTIVAWVAVAIILQVSLTWDVNVLKLEVNSHKCRCHQLSQNWTHAVLKGGFTFMGAVPFLSGKEVGERGTSQTVCTLRSLVELQSLIC